MASSGDIYDGSTFSSKGIRIRSQEDLDRVLAQVRKKENALRSVQKKLKMREARLAEAEKKQKKRNDFLDAWEVSLKSKEAEMVEERQELESMKQSLRKIGQELLALSDKTDSVFEGLPYEEDIFVDMVEEETPEEKKPILGFLKNITKKDSSKSPKRKGRSKKRRPETKSKGSPQRRKTLRDTLEEKRDRLKTATVETSGLDELEELLQDEVFSCPKCEEDVSANDDVCPGCGAELNWGS
jgi:DNA repair exonuclease SbcCD ATPase subunit